MPHPTAIPAAHDAHDLLLVVAYAAGDAAGAELETAAALVASCADCADLHRDLRSIAAATAALPAPVRTRDFRLTHEQAEAIRPTGWRRLAAALAGPRFSFAAPLGGTLAAMGLAGILVAGTIGLPGTASTPGADQAAGGATANGPVENQSAAGVPAPSPAAPLASDGAAVGPEFVATTDTSAQPSTSADKAAGQGIGGLAATTGPAGVLAPSLNPDGGVTAPRSPDAYRPNASVDPNAVVGPSGAPVAKQPVDAPVAPQPPAPVLLLLAIAALLGGATMAGLRLAARRLA